MILIPILKAVSLFTGGSLWVLASSAVSAAEALSPIGEGSSNGVRGCIPVTIRYGEYLARDGWGVVRHAQTAKVREYYLSRRK